MKQTLFTILSAMLILTSCSKKDDSNPEETNSVTITGKEYSTVTIGTQVWTSVNYNGAGGTNYDNSATNDATYGKLYTWEEAKPVQLPSGWRLPTKADFETLLLHLGGTKDGNNIIEGNASVNQKLKSKTGWLLTQGSNSSGFNAFPAGRMSSWDNNDYLYKGEGADFWSSTPSGSSGESYYFSVSNWNEGGTIYDEATLDAQRNDMRFSVRFVKDK